MEHITEEDTSKQLSIKNNIHLDDTTTTTRLDDKAIEPTHNMVLLSSAARGQRSRSESILEEESSMDITSIKVDSISSRKPLILRMPQSESFSSLSDIMKRIQSQKTAAGLLKKGLNATVPEMSQSMVDLSTINTDINHDGREVPVPRSKCFEHGAMTPAFTLMRKRNDGFKSTLHRSQKTLLLRERPRSYNYGLNMDWKKSMMEWEGEEE